MVWPAEPGVDQLLRLGGLGVRVVEAAVAELAERAGAEHAGTDHDEQAEREQELGSPGHELAVPLKHDPSPR